MILIIWFNDFRDIVIIYLLWIFVIDCYLPLRNFWLSWLMVMFVTFEARLAVEIEDNIEQNNRYEKMDLHVTSKKIFWFDYVQIGWLFVWVNLAFILCCSLIPCWLCSKLFISQVKINLPARFDIFSIIIIVSATCCQKSYGGLLEVILSMHSSSV